MAKVELVKSDTVLKIGQRIEVTVLNAIEENTYMSRVEDFDSQNLVLAMPMDKGYPIIPISGSTIHARLATKNSAYRFNTIFSTKKLDPIPVWVVAMPMEVEKHQRRAFVRVDATISLKIQVEDDAGTLSPAIYASTKDISGGGLRIIMKHPLEKGTKIYIESENIPIIGKLEVWCEVIRTVNSFKDKNIFWVGVKFIDLAKDVHSNLIRYIFNRQREMLSKKVLE